MRTGSPGKRDGKWSFVYPQKVERSYLAPLRHGLAQLALPEDAKLVVEVLPPLTTLLPEHTTVRGLVMALGSRLDARRIEIALMYLMEEGLVEPDGAVGYRVNQNMKEWKKGGN